MASLYGRIEVLTGDKFELHPYFSRTSFEQFPYQLSGKEYLTRTRSVVLDTPVDIKRMKTKADFDELLGAPIDDLATSTFILYGIAKVNKGMITPAQIQELVDGNADRVPSYDSIMATLDRLSASIEGARPDALQAEQFKGGLQKYGYNPLTRTPFIRVTNDFFIAPQTFFILRACTLENFYYLGMRRWPKLFGSDLGHRAEAYTGLQLQHTGELEVYPEITWDGKKSIDWFVVTSAVTLLIECKSARANMDTRVGAASAAPSIADKLAWPSQQIDKTVIEIENDNPAFDHIPTDLPMVGLIVTAEPLYNGNFAEVRKLIPEPKIPILSLPIRDLESLATLSPEVLGETLLKIANDPDLSQWDVFSSVRELLGKYREEKPNTLLDASYLRHVLPAAQAVELALGSAAHSPIE